MGDTPPLFVVGASAGGIEAMQKLLSGLPAAFPGALAVVIHVSPTTRSFIPEILSRAGPLRAAHPTPNERIRAGRVYVAPPDRHLLIRDGAFDLSRGPRENGFRPSIDATFRSASASHGSGVVGVILSGALDDGTAGLVAIKSRGGLAVVQDPADAAFPDMPRSAIRYVDVDFQLPLADIPSTLARLARELMDRAPRPRRAGNAMPQDPSDHPDPDHARELDESGKRALFSCPECGGALWEIENRDLVVFRCHVGHAFNPEAFRQAQAETTERALWRAARLLQENVLLNRRLARRAAAAGSKDVAQRFEDRAREAEAHETTLRGLLHAVPSLHDAAAQPTEGADDRSTTTLRPTKARRRGDPDAA